MQTLVDRQSLWISGTWADVQARLRSLIETYGKDTALVDVLRLLHQ